MNLDGTYRQPRIASIEMDDLSADHWRHLKHQKNHACRHDRRNEQGDSNDSASIH
jgi:hypothetical protein